MRFEELLRVVCTDQPARGTQGDGLAVKSCRSQASECQETAYGEAITQRVKSSQNTLFYLLWLLNKWGGGVKITSALERSTTSKN